MSKTRIVFSVFVLSISLVAVGAFGANAFSKVNQAVVGDSEDSPAAENEKKSSAEDSGMVLLPVSGEKPCDEITHPVVIEKVNPKYPSSAKDEKVMGMVTVETVINEEGVLEDIQVIKSPDDRLTAAAVEAIQQWKFEPALCDGTPVGVYYNLTVNFSLQ